MFIYLIWLNSKEDNNEQGGEVDYDKIMAEQAAKLMAGKGKGGPIQKKQPLLNKDKYDSLLSIFNCLQKKIRFC